jgi:hypothetical protein
MKSLSTIKSIIGTKDVISNSSAIKGGAAKNNFNQNIDTSPNTNTNNDYTIGEPWDNRKRPGTKG